MSVVPLSKIVGRPFYCSNNSLYPTRHRTIIVEPTPFHTLTPSQSVKQDPEPIRPSQAILVQILESLSLGVRLPQNRCTALGSHLPLFRNMRIQIVHFKWLISRSIYYVWLRLVTVPTQCQSNSKTQKLAITTVARGSATWRESLPARQGHKQGYKHQRIQASVFDLNNRPKTPVVT